MEIEVEASQDTNSNWLFGLPAASASAHLLNAFTATFLSQDDDSGKDAAFQRGQELPEAAQSHENEVLP